MATEFTMPKLGHLMEEGTVVSWEKDIGETIEKGEILLEIEMDKATMEVESSVSGTVMEILVQEGEVVPVGAPLAIIE
ncbi:MAG: biotin attachment protein [Gammaproteobacteria bacterium]|nr:MAG: biotin attachment protein [Gammaproteobacteria bacterium]